MKAINEDIDDSVLAVKKENTDMKGMDMNSNVSLRTKIFVAITSIIILAIGISAARYWGDLSMKPKGEMKNMDMSRIYKVIIL
ncbi:hypothetical protein QN349_16230 [Mucilaginibacter sp. 10B2]|nr:hypothetical protein [Mucilaginibacter sp. 10B2]